MSVRSIHARDEQLLDIYWKAIRNNQPLPRESEQEQFARMRAGDETARQRIVESNLRFVLQIASNYARADGPSVLELVAEGNMGLLTAVRRFDENLGYKFITYAVWWIRRSIHLAIANHGHAMRLPMNRMEDHRLLEREGASLEQQLGRTATFDELVEAAGVNSGRALNALQASDRALSMEAPLGGDTDSTLHAVLPAAPQDEEIDAELMLSTLAEGLKQLDERDATILKDYYGFEDDEPKTLEKIGEKLGITRERVRQLRNRALHRMRDVCGDQLQPLMAN